MRASVNANRSREKRRRWIARWFFGVVLLAALGWFGGRHLHLNRKISLKIAALQSAGYTVTLDQMKRLYPDVPDEQNAAVALGKAFAEFVTANTNDVNLPLIGKGKLPAHGSPVPDKMLGAIRIHVDSNQSAWEAARQAIKLPRCRFPIDHDISFETLLPHLPRIKGLVQLGRLRAAYFTAIDQIDDAIEAVATTLSVSELVGKEPLLISQLVKFGVQAGATRGVESMMNLQQFSQSQLRSLQTALLTAPEADGLQKALMTELYSHLKIFKDARLRSRLFNSITEDNDDIWMDVGLFVMRASGQLSEDCLFFLNDMGNLIEAAREPFPVRLERAEAVGLRVQEAKEMGNPKAVPVLSGMILPSLSRAFVKEAEVAALVRATGTAVAVERFRSAKDGRLPETLDDLVPEFMSAVPMDPFVPGPLRFQKLEAGYRVYSVGPDRLDDGGQPKLGEETRRYDILFTVKRDWRLTTDH